MIGGFRNKALRRLWTKGDASGIRPDWTPRVRRMLDAIDAAGSPNELNIPGFGFHALTGDLAGRYPLVVSRNWRLTFSWVDDTATDIDLEDYHGS